MYLQREAQRVTLAGICTSDLQVKHGSVPRAALGVTVGHEMYGKNLTFKTGGVDGCKCAETLALIEQGKIDTTPLITHTFPLRNIAEAYDLFENRRDGVVKIAIQMES